MDANDGDTDTVKQLEKLKKRLRDRLLKLMNEEAKDGGLVRRRRHQRPETPDRRAPSRSAVHQSALRPLAPSGHLNKKIREYHYVAERSFDASLQ